MKDKIMFQGHEFVRRGDGFYETTDVFEFDEHDWSDGIKYPGYAVLFHEGSPRLMATDKQHVLWMKDACIKDMESVLVSSAIPDSIEFQGHVFTRRGDGLYETEDVFVFDEEDWGLGEKYPGYIVLMHIEKEMRHPYLISISDVTVNTIIEVDRKDRGDFRIAPDCPMGEIICPLITTE